MSVFAISFRIKKEGDYTGRYGSLMEAIQQEAIGHTWEETTSFYLIRSDKTSSDLADALYFGSDMISDDTLLVVNLSRKGYATCGEISYPNTLESLMTDR